MAAMEFLMMALNDQKQEDEAGKEVGDEFCCPAVVTNTGEEASMFADAAMKAGKAIIDCGATNSIGSLEALDLLAQKNAEVHGDTRMSVDTATKPWYTFGNGNRRQCASQVTFDVKAGPRSGKCPINSLEADGVPILLAVNALKRLGAIIDFENNVASFKKVDPNVLVHLESGGNGHLYLSLVEDLLTNEVTDADSVQALVPFARRVLALTGASAAER